MSTDGPAQRSPRPSFPAPSPRSPAADDLDAALDALAQRAASALGAGDGRDLHLGSRTGRPAARRRRTGWTRRGRAGLAAEVADPAHPFTDAATTRVGDVRPRGVACRTDRPFVGAYLPLIVSRGGVDVALGSIGHRLAGAAHASTTPSASPRRPGRAGGLAVDRARLASTAAERSEWFERMAHTDPLTGLANERTVGRHPRARARAGGPPGRARCRSRSSTSTTSRSTNREGGHEAGDDVLRRVAAVLAESVRLVDTVGRIGGDEFVLVAPGSAGPMVARRVLDGIAALPAVAGRPISVSAGVARFPADGADAEALIAAATAALAPGAGRGSRARSRPGSSPRAEPAALGRADASGPVSRPRSPRPSRRSASSALVAPGPGSSVSASTIPSPARAGRCPRSRPSRRVPTCEAAERHRDAVAADDPRLVDLVAARRREVLHRERDRAGGADRGEAGPGAAVGVRIGGQRAGLGAASSTAATLCSYAWAASSWPWSSRFQPPSTTIARTAAMRRTQRRGEVRRAAARSARRPRSGTATGAVAARGGRGRRGARVDAALATAARGEVGRRGGHDPALQRGRRLDDRHATRPGPAARDPSSAISACASAHVARCSRTAAASAGSSAPSTNAAPARGPRRRSGPGARVRMRIRSRCTPRPSEVHGASRAARGASGS